MLETALKWLVPAVLGSGVTYIATLLRKNRALRSGLQCLLRAEIIRSYDKYIGRMCIPIYVKEALEKEYKAYSGLGGNDVASDLYRQLMALPAKYSKEEKICSE